MRFVDETVANEDEFLRYRITERFKQILKDSISSIAFLPRFSGRAFQIDEIQLTLKINIYNYSK